jgi:hypothetical protein
MAELCQGYSAAPISFVLFFHKVHTLETYFCNRIFNLDAKFKTVWVSEPVGSAPSSVRS